MLINTSTKTRYSEIMADSILHFFRLSQERGFFDLIAMCSRDQNSEEFKNLREMLVSMFSANIDNREMLLVFSEIDKLISENGSSIK
jgi:hypothetical protein